MNRRTPSITTTTWSRCPLSATLALGFVVGAGACGESDGPPDVYRGTVHFAGFEADPNDSATAGYCDSTGGFADLRGKTADGDDLTILLNNCAPGSYRLVPPADDDTIPGVFSCTFEDASTDQLFEARAIPALPESVCNVTINRFDARVVGSAYGTLVEFDIYGLSRDIIEFSVSFDLAVDPPL
ncbi:MAG: hypothetical protein HY905_02825 [Deltaproteobacteria bacterium]|nr:hypothetical protein [Deltaproteobacteria bacterium]